MGTLNGEKYDTGINNYNYFLETATFDDTTNTLQVILDADKIGSNNITIEYDTIPDNAVFNMAQGIELKPLGVSVQGKKDLE